MALVKCRECGQEVSDQAETCPHCGIKSPSGVHSSRQQNIPRSEDADVVLRLGDVVVTTTLAKFPSQTFPINGIGSVTITAPRYGGWIMGAALFGVLAICVSGTGGISAFGLFLFILAGLFIFIGFSKKSGLIIRTASGDARAMEGDGKTLDAIKRAIEQAATIRG
jgi:hypothetical protein